MIKYAICEMFGELYQAILTEGTPKRGKGRELNMHVNRFPLFFQTFYFYLRQDFTETDFIFPFQEV